MSRPIQEPSVQRQVSNLTWGENQLFRRPAPESRAGYEIKVFGDRAEDPVVSTGDSLFVWAVPTQLDGWFLETVMTFVSTVSSGGDITVQIRNVTQAQDMLSTLCTIDAGEFTSCTADVPPVVDVTTNQVTACDLLAIDVDSAGTAAKGLGVVITMTPVQAVASPPAPPIAQSLSTTVSLSSTEVRRRAIRTRSFRIRPFRQ